MLSFRPVYLAVAVSVITGCAGQNPSSPSAVSPSLAGSLSAQPTAKEAGGPTVYVEGQNSHKPVIVVYGNGGATFLRTIKHGAAIAANSSGYVFIAHSPVTAYADQGETLVQKFSVHNGPSFNVISADGLGNFYVFCDHKPYKMTLCEYSLGTQGPVRQLDADEFSSIASDQSGNLYLGLSSKVVIYGPTGTTPLRTLTSGIAAPRALAVDSQGNLFVANWSPNVSPNIVEYPAGTSTPSRTITDGVTAPDEMTTDSSGDLALLNGYNGTDALNVAIYTPGSNSPSAVITNGIDGPESLAFDQSGNLYVVNTGSSFHDPGNVTVYAAGSYTLLRTITKKLDEPLRIAVGP